MSSPIDNTWPNPPCANLPTLEKRKFQEDGNGNVCVNVCVATSGTATCIYASNTDNDGSEDCFLSYTVPASKEFQIEQIVVAFQQSGEFLIKHEGSTIMRLITSAGQPTISVNFTPKRPIAAGEVIEVCFCSAPEPGEYSATLLGSLNDI